MNAAWSCRPRLHAALIIAVLAAASPAFADGILIAVEETVNGAPCPPPRPATEGIYASLFEGGTIVFDIADSMPGRTVSELADIGRTAGADLVLQVTVSYRETNSGLAIARVDASIRYTLIETGTGVVRKRGDLAASNEGREKEVDRMSLGREISEMILREIIDTRGGAFSPP